MEQRLDSDDEIERLQTENWQLRQACGYPIPADKETPQNPFRCGICDARATQPAAPAQCSAGNARLADELQKLCCAETEGKFFDCVTDNIATIIQALRSVAQPSAGTEDMRLALAEEITDAAGDDIDSDFLVAIVDAILRKFDLSPKGGGVAQPPSRLTFCETCNGNTMHRRAAVVAGIQTFECQRCALSSTER